MGPATRPEPWARRWPAAHPVAGWTDRRIVADLGYRVAATWDNGPDLPGPATRQDNELMSPFAPRKQRYFRGAKGDDADNLFVYKT